MPFWGIAERLNLVFRLLRIRALGLALFLFVPTSAMAEASEEVLRSLGSGFGRFTPMGLAIVGFALISILALIVVLEIIRSDSRQREKIDIGWQYFSDMATQKQLTPQETEMLRRIVESGGI